MEVFPRLQPGEVPPPAWQAMSDWMEQVEERLQALEELTYNRLNHEEDELR